MPDSRIPKMTHHKASGQAVVRLAGRDLYLGAWQSNAARADYDRLIAEWLASGRRAPGCRGGQSEPVKPVLENRVCEVLPLVSAQVIAMIQHQQITGMRSGEVVVMRGAYAGRAVIEQCIGWLKEFRRIGTRYEKFEVNFKGMFHLAMIKRYFKLLF